jgi:hypothetical protein
MCFPKKRGLWLCASYGNATENGPGWTTNAKGRATCMVGKAASKPKIDHADTIVHDALETDNSFHWEGGAYVEVTRKGKKETLHVNGGTCARLLRVRYRNLHRRVCWGESIKNAIDQLTATAIEESDEIPVYVRVAPHEGMLYIDLAGRDRNIVAIDANGYRPVKEAPVRFLRTVTDPGPRMDCVQRIARWWANLQNGRWRAVRRCSVRKGQV